MSPFACGECDFANSSFFMLLPQSSGTMRGLEPARTCQSSTLFVLGSNIVTEDRIKVDAIAALHSRILRKRTFEVVSEDWSWCRILVYAVVIEIAHCKRLTSFGDRA